jgi:hypothetical protein
MSASAGLVREITIALGVATMIVIAALTVIVRRLRRRPFAGEPR